MKQPHTARVKVAVNATPLIYFAKAGALSLLTGLFEIITDNNVYREVVEEGLKRGSHDAAIVMAAIKKGEIKIVETPHLQELPFRLGPGELSVIQLVRNGLADMVLIDDSYARKVCRKMGLKAHGTLYVLKRAVTTGLISREEAIRMLNKMVKAGYWLSPQLLAYFYENV